MTPTSGANARVANAAEAVPARRPLSRPWKPLPRAGRLLRTDAEISDAILWNEQGKMPSIWGNQMHHLFLRLSLVRPTQVRPAQVRLAQETFGLGAPHVLRAPHVP